MERVKAYFQRRQAAFLIDRIRVFTESSATVELAAQRLQCDPSNIAKSIACVVRKPVSKAENKLRQNAKKQQQQQQQGGENKSEEAISPNNTNNVASPTDSTASEGGAGNYIVIVTAGDAKVSSKRFKAKFSAPQKMLKADEVEAAVGYPVGGVCPFGLNEGVKVYLDVSLRRFEKVYPACGTSNTGIPVTMDELERYADHFAEWIDVCEGWRTEANTAEGNKLPAAAAEKEEQANNKKPTPAVAVSAQK